MKWLGVGFALSLLLSPSAVLAHGSSLGVFKATEQAPNVYSILWKVNRPAAGATVEDIVFQSGCSLQDDAERLTHEGITRTQVSLHCSLGPGLGKVIFPDNPPGLHVMVEAGFLDGTRVTTLLREERETELAPEMAQSGWIQAWRYGVIGVEHILLGPDHLLFVLGILLLVTSGRALVAAVTAFTLAHSVTLALAVLGFVSLKPAPMEACIALSIVLLAREVITDADSLSKRLPWLVAFGFGLLHGLGFAGALREVGLPEDQLALALVSFNVGVELGQLLFVGVVWKCRELARRRDEAWGRSMRTCAAYGMGSLSVYWVIERMAWVL